MVSYKGLNILKKFRSQAKFANKYLVFAFEWIFTTISEISFFERRVITRLISQAILIFIRYFLIPWDPMS